MFCRLVGYLRRGKTRQKQLLADILSSLYPAVELPKGAGRTFNQIEEWIKEERGTELISLSPFWYPVIFYLSLLNLRANTYLAYKFLEKENLLDAEIKRRQYKVFHIYAVKENERRKIFATSDRGIWEYWYLLFNLVVSAPPFLKEELKRVGEEYYKRLPKS